MANELIEEHLQNDYKWGFTTNIEADEAPKGLNEDIIKFISAKKNEPEWLLEFRLKAFRNWQNMVEPDWAHVHYPKPNFQDIIYYSAPKPKKELASLDEVDPELLKTFEKLGISLEEQKRLSGVQSNIAVDIVFDSVSVKTTFKETLAEKGIIFCSFSEAVQEYPELVKKYMGMVIPPTDNFYAALNSAVFTDGSFCYWPQCFSP
jgi:Fe-S cluster assembly protein SufB